MNEHPARKRKKHPSLEYLSRLAVPSRTSKFTDIQILTLAVYKELGWNKRPELHPDVFAESIGIDPPSDATLTDDEIRDLGQNLDFIDYKYPEGSNLTEQIDSILPENPKVLPFDKKLRIPLNHLLKHLIRGFYVNFKPSEFYPGLDVLSSILFTLNHIAEVSGTPIRWPQELNKELQTKTPDWHRLALRPDGVLRSGFDWLTARLRNRIRSLRYKPLRLMIGIVNDCKEPSLLKKQDIEQTAKVSRAASRMVYENLQQLITERFLISMPSIGLRHRCILSLKRSVPWPVNSLYERALVDGKKIGSIQFYLEPESSDGPTDSTLRSIVANKEIVSLRMDLFDPFSKEGEELGKWEHRAFEDSSFQPERKKEWLYAESNTKSKYAMPSELERGVLSILWTHRGSAEQRMKLLETFDIPSASWRIAMKKMLDQKMLSVLYHPSLEYCALPQGIYVAVEESTKADVDDTCNWLCKSFPYVHILRSDEEFLALIRLPEGIAYYKSVIEREVTEKHQSPLIAEHEAQRTYFITALSRLYSAPDAKWKNPWIDSL